jgi:hypothetical protein
LGEWFYSWLFLLFSFLFFTFPGFLIEGASNNDREMGEKYPDLTQSERCINIRGTRHKLRVEGRATPVFPLPKPLTQLHNPGLSTLPIFPYPVLWLGK